MVQRKILKNGMTVLFKKKRGGVVSVAFAVRNGGRNEVAKEKGISHFIEHMLYKGTPKRNSMQISAEIEKNGGELNGFTSERMTAFWCKMPSRHIKVALDVLSDMVKNPLFDENELNKERKVIFEEMKLYHDTPSRYTAEKIKSLMYRGDFSVPIIGTESSMNSISRKKLTEFFKKVYASENMILCVVGDTDFRKVCSFAENNFIKKSGKVAKPKIILSNSKQIERRNGIDQANLVFAHHIPLPNKKGYYSAQVLNMIMAGGMSSRPFSEIREKRNLAYSIRGETDSEGEYAYSLIAVGTPPENVQKIERLIVEEFKKVSEKLSEKELSEVKEQIIGNYLIYQEDSFNVLANLLMEEIKGNALNAEKFIDNIKKVKLSEVKKLAKIKKYSFFALVPDKHK